MPRDYDATDLWRTRDPKAIGRVASELATKLKKAQSWGKSNVTQIAYLTPRAICQNVSETEFTGGALAFFGSDTETLAALDGPPIDDTLASLIDEPTLRSFGAKLFEASVDDIDLDRPYLDGFDVVSFRDDVTPCLQHEAGSVVLVGGAVRSANSARRFTHSAVVGPAPETLAPGHHAVDFEAMRAKVPDLLDAFVSPGEDMLIALVGKEGEKPSYLAWDALGRHAPSPVSIAGRPVMEEWATGATMDAWLASLRPLFDKHPKAGAENR